MDAVLDERALDIDGRIVVQSRAFRVQENANQYDVDDRYEGAHVALVPGTGTIKIDLDTGRASRELVIRPELAAHFFHSCVFWHSNFNCCVFL